MMSDAPAMVTAPERADAAAATPRKVALMGLDDGTAGCLPVIEGDARLTLWAVADTALHRLRPFETHADVRTYVDYRSLVVESAQSGLDLLVVGLPPFQSLEFVELAGTRGINVLHHAPATRTVAEARHLADRFAAGHALLMVSRWWYFEPAFAPLADLHAIIGPIQTVFADVRAAVGATDWRADTARAGGGVLLNGGYDAVDLLVATLGTPETVYARCTRTPQPGATSYHDTEDAAALLLTFAGGCIGSLNVRRVPARPGWNVTFYGAERAVELSPERLTIRPHDGARARHHRVKTPDPFGYVIEAFMASRRPDGLPFPSTIREHLPTVATIEAAYLSARTGEAESPARLLRA